MTASRGASRWRCFRCSQAQRNAHVEHRVGQRRQVVGDLLDAEVALDVAHQRAEDLGVVRAAQRVEQRLLAGLAGALPRRVPRVELGEEALALEAAVQQPLVGQFVDDAGMPHQVAHRPARQAEQPQQPVLHLGPLDQQREVALAPQQRLDPVDEARSRHRPCSARRVAASEARCSSRASRSLLVVAQACTRADSHHGRTRAASSGSSRSTNASLSTGNVPGRTAAASAVAPPTGGRPSCSSASNSVATNSRISPSRPSRSHVVVVAGESQAGGDPREVAVAAGQQMRLLVVEVLDAVLDAAQEGVGVGQPLGGRGLHQPADDQTLTAPSASSACGSRETGRRGPPAAAAR